MSLQLDTRRTVQSVLQRAVDGELQGSQGTDHDQSGWQTSERTTDTQLLGQLTQQANGGLTWSLLGLVDLGQQGVSRLRDDSSGTTSNNTSTQVNNGLGGGGELSLVTDSGRDRLSSSLENQELGDVVRNLLEQDRGETVVEGSKTLLLEDSGETTNQAAGEVWLGHQSDSGGLQWTQSNVGEELSQGSGTDVDRVLVVLGGVVTQLLNEGLLEQLVTTKLEGTLQGVTQDGRAQTSQQGAGTFRGNDLSQRTNQTGVVNGRLQLDSGLDHINWGHGTVGNTTAHGTGKSKGTVVTNSEGRNSSSFLGHCVRIYTVKGVKEQGVSG